MSFRRRIFIIILSVGLIPVILIMALSFSLLNSTLNKVGAGALEKNLENAEQMIEQSQNRLSAVLVDKLQPGFAISDNSGLLKWAHENNVDLAFRISNADTLFALNDSIQIDANSLWLELKGKSGFFHLNIDGRFFLAAARGDSLSEIGCAILMPAGYAESGQRLALAVAASSGLEMYRKLSLKLLGLSTLMAMGLVVFAGLAVSAVVSKQLSKPLVVLGNGARQIGAGNLDFKVELAGDDEFSNLADSFNKMALEISENQKKMMEMQRLVAWREVARRIAHEIRNPLTPINIEIYRLREICGDIQKVTGEKTEQALNSIQNQITILQDLADQFATFAREPELKKSKCSLKQLIENCAQSYSGSQRISIKINIPDNLPSISIDQQMITRVFNNLLKNSIEASQKDIEATIDVSKQSNNINIIFKDNGPGFPREKLEKIDQPYITSKKRGTGLGLVIIEKIIKEHGGQIKFYNDNGAVVEFTLPID